MFVIIITTLIILLPLIYLVLKKLQKRSLKNLEGRYNKDEDKSRQTGQAIDARHYGYRNAEGTRPTEDSERTTDNTEQPTQPVDGLKGRSILSNDEVDKIRPDNSSNRGSGKKHKGIFGGRRRREWIVKNKKKRNKS